MRRPKGDGSQLSDWIEPIRTKGRWARIGTDAAEKALRDLEIVGDTAPAFEAQFGIELSGIRAGSARPDIHARIGDRSVSIELTELMNKSVREKLVRGEHVSWDELQWTEQAWREEVDRLLNEKHARYSKREDGFMADALLIHSCELWLNPSHVEGWLGGNVFHPRDTIRSAYFTQERLPNWPKPQWPLFRLYGDLSGAAV